MGILLCYVYSKSYTKNIVIFFIFLVCPYRYYNYSNSYDDVCNLYYNIFFSIYTQTLYCFSTNFIRHVTFLNVSAPVVITLTTLPP